MSGQRVLFVVQFSPDNILLLLSPVCNMIYMLSDLHTHTHTHTAHDCCFVLCALLCVQRRHRPLGGHYDIRPLAGEK